MERELWQVFYGVAKKFDSGWGHWKFSEADILLVYLWAVVHDRPTSWATKPENWIEEIRPPVLPSQSTLSRRLRKASLQQFMTQIEETWLSLCGAAMIQIMDGKSLAVSRVSKDADASVGRGAGGMHKGYKLHAIWAEGPLPLAWSLTPLHVHEKRAAQALLRDLPGQGYLLGDTAFDVNELYDLAHESGYQLLAKKYRGGLGHRRHSPHRLRSIELLKGRFGKQLYAYRKQIERNFGTLTNFGGGLASLPAWVRRFPRVRHWVHAKLLINAARWFRKNQPQLLALA